MRILLSILLLSTTAHAKWICNEASSIRKGDSIQSCGIGIGPTEADARTNSLERAFEEFNSICNESSDCKDFEKLIEPQRTECIENEGTYKCYRAFTFYISKKPKEKYMDKSKELKLLEKIIEEKDSNNTDLKNTIKQESDNVRKDLKQLEKKIDSIKQVPTTQIIEKRIEVIVTTETYHECMNQYQKMMFDLQSEMTISQSSKIYRQAQDKLRQCQNIKK